jgi:hypothetical protein
MAANREPAATLHSLCSNHVRTPSLTAKGPFYEGLKLVCIGQRLLTDAVVNRISRILESDEIETGDLRGHWDQ